MPRKIIEFHPSVVLAHTPDESPLVVMSVYDTGYRMKAYNGSANPPGGNPSFGKGDRSPEDTLRREISEEFDPGFQGPKSDALVFGQRVVWACPTDIQAVRNALSDIKPVGDFYVEFAHQIMRNENKGDSKGTGLYSVYSAIISQDVIEKVRQSVRNGKTISTEGNLNVFSLDDLIKSELGEFAIAHAATPIFNYFFGTHISYPAGVHATPLLSLSPLRKSFQDYESGEFEYSREKPSPDKPSFHESVLG